MIQCSPDISLFILLFIFCNIISYVSVLTLLWSTSGSSLGADFILKKWIYKAWSFSPSFVSYKYLTWLQVEISVQLFRRFFVFSFGKNCNSLSSARHLTTSECLLWKPNKRPNRDFIPTMSSVSGTTTKIWILTPIGCGLCCYCY